MVETGKVFLAKFRLKPATSLRLALEMPEGQCKKKWHT